MSESMGDFVMITLVVVTIVWAICNALYSSSNSKERNEQLLLFATTNNYECSYYDIFNIADAYSYYKILTKGDNSGTRNEISGSIDGKNFKIFDHKYSETYGSQLFRYTVTHKFSAIIVDLPVQFQDLIIRPENFKDKIIEGIGFDNIIFESEAFSQAFHMKSTDKKMAYDIIHPKMMEYLLQHKGWNIEMKKSSIMIRNGKLFDPQDLENYLKFIYGFINLIPEYVWQTCSKTR